MSKTFRAINFGLLRVKGHIKNTAYSDHLISGEINVGLPGDVADVGDAGRCSLRRCVGAVREHVLLKLFIDGLTQHTS